ncbi:MAG: hypothetical protein KJ749_03585 [Planctomycetes bacterium]|nr:hypothetical protein [Planctomycetota bacterium]
MKPTEKPLGSPIRVDKAPGTTDNSAIDGADPRVARRGPRNPYMTEFDGPDGGKMGHYMLRWVNSKAEAGPWSQTASATIGA